MAEINPHIPQFIQSAPWYLETGEKPSLDHQRKRQRKEGSPIDGKAAKTTTFQAEKYRKGACENCGAMTHDRKLCTERPRKLGAKFTNKQIAPDEKILDEEEVDYDAKRDRWNGGNVTGNCFDSVLKRYAACDAARRKYLIGEADGDDDDFRVDEAKVVYFAKVEKRVRTTGDGGSTGSVRNLRIREDTAKYLLDLDVNSAYYDPKTRSMREDPLPEADPNEKFYGGDNRCRNSGQALELKQLDLFSFGQDHIHLQGAPSQAEFLYKNHKNMKEKLKTRTKNSIFEKYGNVASDQEEMPREVLLGQSERQVEYDRAGRIIKGQDQTVLPKSKYELHVCNINNNHTSVWGSWWKDHQWGYKCCKQVFRNSYCTGPAGTEAADQAATIGH